MSSRVLRRLREEKAEQHQEQDDEYDSRLRDHATVDHDGGDVDNRLRYHTMMDDGDNDG